MHFGYPKNMDICGCFMFPSENQALIPGMCEVRNFCFNSTFVDTSPRSFKQHASQNNINTNCFQTSQPHQLLRGCAPEAGRR